MTVKLKDLKVFNARITGEWALNVAVVAESEDAARLALRIYELTQHDIDAVTDVSRRLRGECVDRRTLHHDLGPDAVPALSDAAREALLREADNGSEIIGSDDEGIEAILSAIEDAKRRQPVQNPAQPDLPGLEPGDRCPWRFREDCGVPKSHNFSTGLPQKCHDCEIRKLAEL
jgi:hypothetical protein